MKTILWAAIVTLWCLSIFYFTEASGMTSVSTGNKISMATGVSSISELRTLNMILRKGAHLILFGLLAVFIKIALKNRRRSGLIAWLTATLYGIVNITNPLFPGEGHRR